MISFSVVTFCTGWNINYLNDCTQYLFIVSCRIIFPKPFLNYNVNLGSSGCSPSWMSAPDNTKKNPEFFIILFIHACWFLRYVIYGLFQHHFLLLRRYRKNSSPNARGRCEENQKALCSQSSKKNLKMFFLRKQFLAWPGCFQLNFLLPCLYRWSSVFFSFWSISLRGYLQIV